MTQAQDLANSGWQNGLYNGMTPDDYYNAYGQIPPPPDNYQGGNMRLDSQGRPYISGVSQGPAYYSINPAGLDEATKRGIPISNVNGLHLVNSETPGVTGGVGSGALVADQKQAGLGEFLGNVGLVAGPALAFGALGALGAGGEAAGSVTGGGIGGGAGGAIPGALDYSMTGTLGGGLGTAAAGGTADAAALGGGAVNAATGLGDYSLASGVGGGLGGAETIAGLGAGAGDAAAMASTGGAGPNISGSPGVTGIGSELVGGSDGTTFGIPNNILGGVAQGALGLAGANAQGNALQDVANQYLNIGAPYRGQLAASYQPGFDLSSQPGYGDAFARAADIASRSYSAKMGNPADNPTAQAGILNDVWSQNYLPALSSYRGQLGQFGGLGLNTSGSASLGAADQTGNAYNAIGAGLNTALNPPTDIASLLKQLGTNGSQNYSLNVGGLPLGSK